MTTAHPRKKIAIVATTSFALRVYIAMHVQALSKDYDIVIYSNFDVDPCTDLFSDTVQLVDIPFARKISLLTDLRTIFTLYKALWREDFTLIHSLMPKSGLLAMVAGYFARIPIRVHLFTGQVWATRSGAKRFFLKLMDRVIDWFATDILVDSPSQRDFLKAERVVANARVLGTGSVCGVDTLRFRPNPEWRHDTRRDLGISQDAFVFGYVGRMNHDKGVLDLALAFSRLQTKRDVHLVFTGPDEEGMQAQIMAAHPEIQDIIHFTGHTRTPEVYMNVFDVLCLPSYREGFGSTVIEAAACKVPALVSHIYGLTDAVEENITGTFHQPGNPEDLSEAMNTFLNNPDFCEKLGNSAYKRCLDQFSSDLLILEMKKFYTDKMQPSTNTNGRIK
jgi:glycosyltransferase involved in cell wall biosynthesis